MNYLKGLIPILKLGLGDQRQLTLLLRAAL